MLTLYFAPILTYETRMFVRSAAAVLGVVFCTWLPSCQRHAEGGTGTAKSETTAKVPPASVEPRASASTAVAAAVATQLPDGVKLVSNGAEPRKPLRYVFTKGHTHQLSLVQKNQVKVKVGEESMPETDVPPIRTTIEWNVAEVKPDSSRIEFKVLSAKVEGDPKDPMAKQVNEMLADFKAFHGSQRTDSQGRLLEFTVDQNGVNSPQVAQMLESIKQSLGQLIAPLPDEAIGVGGAWQVTSHLDQFGIQLMQQATYTVTAIRPTNFDVDVSLVQSAPPGKVSPPGMPEGMTVQLVTLLSNGQGKATIDFQNFIAKTDASVTMAMKMLIPEGPGIPRGGQSLHMDMAVSMKIVPTK